MILSEQVNFYVCSEFLLLPFRGNVQILIFFLGAQKWNQKMPKNSVNMSDEDEYKKNSRKTVSELIEVQKILEPSHIFKITVRILILFGKPESYISTLPYNWDDQKT